MIVKTGVTAVVKAAVAVLIAVLLFHVPEASAAGKLKKVVAVSRFENKSSWSGQWNLDDGMADQLTDALVQSGRFVVLERQTLSDVLAEQDLASSGRAMKSRSARTGKLTSAQVLIKGAITEFALNSSGSGTGIGIGGFRIGSKRGDAHVGLIIRLIDTTTGEVLDSHRVEGKAESGGLSLGVDLGGVSFGTEGFKKTPLGKATQIAIDNAVEYIASKLDDLPFEGRVIKVKGDVVYISAGKRHDVSKGEKFAVYSVGEELVDPETGEMLGAEEEELGDIEVFQVSEKFSKARPVGSISGKIERGNIIRSR